MEELLAFLAQVIMNKNEGILLFERCLVSAVCGINLTGQKQVIPSLWRCNLLHENALAEAPAPAPPPPPPPQ